MFLTHNPYYGSKQLNQNNCGEKGTTDHFVSGLVIHQGNGWRDEGLKILQGSDWEVIILSRVW